MARSALLMIGALVVPLLPLLAHCRHGETTHLEMAGHCHARSRGHALHSSPGSEGGEASLGHPHVSHEPASRTDLRPASPNSLEVSMRVGIAPAPVDTGGSAPDSGLRIPAHENRGPPSGPRLHLLLESHLL